MMCLVAWGLLIPSNASQNELLTAFFQSPLNLVKGRCRCTWLMMTATKAAVGLSPTHSMCCKAPPASMAAKPQKCARSCDQALKFTAVCSKFSFLLLKSCRKRMYNSLFAVDVPIVYVTYVYIIYDYFNIYDVSMTSLHHLVASSITAPPLDEDFDALDPGDAPVRRLGAHLRLLHRTTVVGPEAVGHHPGLLGEVSGAAAVTCPLKTRRCQAFEALAISTGSEFGFLRRLQVKQMSKIMANDMKGKAP